MAEEENWDNGSESPAGDEQPQETRRVRPLFRFRRNKEEPEQTPPPEEPVEDEMDHGEEEEEPSSHSRVRPVRVVKFVPSTDPEASAQDMQEVPFEATEEILEEDMDAVFGEVEEEAPFVEAEDVSEVGTPFTEAEEVAEVEVPFTEAEEVTEVEVPFTEAEEVAEVEAPFVDAEEVSEEETPFTEAEEVSEEEAPFTEAEEVAGVEEPFTEAEGVSEEEPLFTEAEEIAEVEAPIAEAEEVGEEEAPFAEAEEVTEVEAPFAEAEGVVEETTFSDLEPVPQEDPTFAAAEEVVEVPDFSEERSYAVAEEVGEGPAFSEETTEETQFSVDEQVDPAPEVPFAVIEEAEREDIGIESASSEEKPEVGEDLEFRQEETPVRFQSEEGSPAKGRPVDKEPIAHTSAPNGTPEGGEVSKPQYHKYLKPDEDILRRTPTRGRPSGFDLDLESEAEEIDFGIDLIDPNEMKKKKKAPKKGPKETVKPAKGSIGGHDSDAEVGTRELGVDIGVDYAKRRKRRL